MLVYKPAEVNQYEEFEQLFLEQEMGYLERTMDLMELTWDQFSYLFRTVGQVYGIYELNELAGFFWIELREKILHLHGLILKDAFRGRGIGTQVLRHLEDQDWHQISAIELGVHKSNDRAKMLYKRMGYETVKTLDELGFQVMQKKFLREPRATET